MLNPLFVSQKNRNAAFARLGGKAAGLRKTSIRNQRLHPEYVQDYTRETGRTFETGFGNTDYQTFFAVLYSYAGNPLAEYRARVQRIEHAIQGKTLLDKSAGNK